MDSNARESSDSAEFRKPSNDAAYRKYRRRSPVGGSSSSDGSPRNRHSLSPAPSWKETARVDDKRKRDDDRNQSGRSDEPHKSSDRHSSRSHYRQDDCSRRDRHVDNYDRGHAKSSYRSRDSRGNNNLDYSRSDKNNKSRDYANEADTCSHGKADGLKSRNRDKDSYDRTGSGRRHAADEERDWDRDRDRNKEGRADHYGKTDNKKSFVGLKSDRSPAYEESKGLRNGSFARRGSSVCHVKEAAWRDGKELDSERHANDEKRRDDGRGTYKEQANRESKERSDDTSIKGQDSEKPNFLALGSPCPGTDGTSEPFVTDSDIDAARIAAMKAAELVNKNLVGTGYMSTDQKKKLLWGNKKSSATEESTAHRWDTPMFGDRERQEKFNKLMGVKADAKVENHGDNPDMEKQREQLQMDLEKQYTAGLRRRDGRTVGLGL